MSAITVHGLTKRFGTGDGAVVAVDNLTFTLEHGTVTGFLGPNGAGKTTTLRMLLGLVQPTAGEALIGGRPYREITDPSREVGAVLEASSFHPGRRARDHLLVLATAAGLPASRVDQALQEVDLADAARRRVGGFSLGMRQRLALAGALLGDPGVLILDEPANGLDPEGVHWLRAFLRHLADEGRTVLVSSHVLSEVAQTVDQVLIMAHGRLITQESVADLTTAHQTDVRIRTPQPEQLRRLLRSKGIAVRTGQAGEPAAPGTLIATGTSPEAVGRAIAPSGIVIYELSANQETLENAFLQLTA